MPNVTTTKKCIECGNDFTSHSNSSKFCTVRCRELAYRKSGKAKERWTKNNHKNQLLEGLKTEGKGKCLICGLFSKAPAMHAYQKHGVTAHDYKEAYRLPYGKGLLPEELKIIKREYVFTNKTVNNLSKGKTQRFKKGEERVYDGLQRRKELGQIKRYNKK